ncbi:MAG: NAD(P)H-dependent oxidoreductase subunit E [Dehalococcoidales bacterium]
MDDTKIEQIINRYQDEASSLIQILLDIQKETRWLSNEILEKVSQKLEVPFSKVLHTATFFKSFSVIPEGRHEIQVCNGTSCHVRGSSRVLGTVQDLTGIKPGETDPDLKFSLEAVTCLGGCSSGPVMVVDGKHHVRMDPTGAEDVLKNCD